MDEVFVKDTESFLKLNKKEHMKISFNCKSCGKLTTIQYRKSRETNQKRLLCTTCGMKATNFVRYGTKISSQAESVKNKISKKLKTDIPDEIFVNNTEDFDRLQKKTKMKIIFNCQECGKRSQFLYQATRNYKQRLLLCTECNKKHKTTDSIFVSPDNLSDVLDTLKDGSIISFNCCKCGKKTTMSYKKTRIESVKKLLCFQCKKSQTDMERYGVPSASMSKSVKEKLKQTNMKKYGVPCTFQLPEAKLHAKEKARELFGVDFPLESKDIQDKANKTLIDKFGVNNPLKSDEIKNKVFQTNLLKYGSRCVLSNKDVQESIKKTNLEKYGVTNPMLSSEYVNERKIRNREKYGVEWESQRPEIKDKAKHTNLVKYGSEFPHWIKHSFFNGKPFDSSWELAFYIYCLDKGDTIECEPIELKYTYNDIEHVYIPDFRVNGELIEIKGDQFFKKDGTMQNPYDHSKDGLFEAKHQCGLKNNVKFLKKSDMIDIMNYVNNTYTQDFLKLFNTNIPFPYLNEDFQNQGDYGIIQHFHKSIFEAHRSGYPSPLEAWKNKDLVLKSALNRLKYIGRCCPSDIIQGFNIAKIAPKVSVFSPNLAKQLILKYLPDVDTIYDPFSGFSGRMIGAYRCGKKYIGSDINSKHVSESNEIINYLNIQDSVNVSIDDILFTSIKTLDNNDALFTCPPYNDKEVWNEHETFKNCDEWIDMCMIKYACKKYLFVVDRTEKYKNYIVDTIINKSHFGVNREFILFIDKS